MEYSDDQKAVAREFIQKYLEWGDFLGKTINRLSASTNDELIKEIYYQLGVKPRTGTYVMLLAEAQKRNEESQDTIPIPDMLVQRAKDDKDLMTIRYDEFIKMHRISISDKPLEFFI